MSVCFHRLAAPGQLVLFAMGGTAYLALEIAWRGTTHWTMFLAGGACLCALDALGRLPLPTPLLAGIGAVGVSVLELGTGLACRRLLHVEVWDYSQEWGNLAGCNLVRRTEKGRLRRRGWGLRWEKAQKGGKGTNLRGFFED